MTWQEDAQREADERREYAEQQRMLREEQEFDYRQNLEFGGGFARANRSYVREPEPWTRGQILLGTVLALVTFAWVCFLLWLAVRSAA